MNVRLPNGIVLAARPLAERRARDPDRDYGLYLDLAWRPTWPATVIDWPDFGLPTDPNAAATAILSVYERAAAGTRIEIGCIGGAGRTGTVVACMAVLAGVPAAEAVAWVRANYRRDAVETSDQASWVKQFAEWAVGRTGFVTWSGAPS